MNSTVFLHLFRQGFDVSRVELNFIAVLQQEGDRGMFVFEELERFRVRARFFLLPERELTMKFQPTIERLGQLRWRIEIDVAEMPLKIRLDRSEERSVGNGMSA